jgi:hypothetical protein
MFPGAVKPAPGIDWDWRVRIIVSGFGKVACPERITFPWETRVMLYWGTPPNPGVEERLSV